MKRKILGIIVAAVTVAGVITSQAALALSDKSADAIRTALSAQQPFTDIQVSAPDIPKPDWYYKVTFTYTVSKNGATSSDFNEFAALASATLNDSRGWTRLGVRFQQVNSGGMFNLVLSQASLLPTYSSGCSAEWSCRAGNNVVINDTRWANASPSWNSGGGSLRDYRHMVVNHEVGHWLGHDHRSCGGAGQPAPLMQQQSIDLQGCTFNPWPLASELWSSRL